MIVKLEARRQAEREEREFLVKARSWTDSTGNHKVDAVLVDANSWGVKLMKQDGTSVNVPMNRLSRSDRSWVHAKAMPRAEENRLMLAGL